MTNRRSLLHWLIPCLSLLLVFLSAMTVSEEGGDSKIYENCSSGELASIGKVWGFLKYYHPEFRRGKLDVDEFLFEGLNRICRESSESVSSYFGKFFQRYSVYERVSAASDLENLSFVGDESDQVPQSDLEKREAPQWIYGDPNINLSARNSLLEVFDCSRESDSFYNKINESTKMSNFDSEEVYSGEELTAELKMLSLFRVWNAVEYYFPHKESVPGGWSGVLGELVTDFVSTNSDTQYLKAIRELLVRMEDGHATIFEDEGNLNRQMFGDKVAPMLVTYANDRFLVKAVFDKGSNRKGGLVIGDSILSVDGKSVGDIKNYLEQYTSSSNQHFKNQVIAKYLTISKKDHVLLEVKREGEILKLAVDTVGRGAHRRMLGNWVARNHGQVFNNGATLYMHINAFRETELSKDFGEYQNIIVDLRGYPWKTDNADVMKYFLDKGVPFAAIRFPSSTLPGSFETEKIARTHLERAGDFDGSLFVLVDHTAISASEYIAMALSKARHSTVIGCQTAGADGNVAFLPLPGGVTVGFTGIEVLYPDGTPTQKVGVAIDVEVCDSQKSVTSGKDIILDRALEMIERSR